MTRNRTRWTVVECFARMPPAVAMDPATPADRPPSPEPGAPIAKDAIDPELIKLRRKRPSIGVVTAAGVVFLCIFFVLRLAPDRRFGGHGDTAADRVPVADVVAGKVELDRYITVDADPQIAHAIRTTVAKGSLGLRVVPARGTGERLWLVVDGDGWSIPNVHGYTGRLRKLGDLPFATSVRDYASEHPRPVFATATAVRAGLASGKVTSVGGEPITVAPGDQVAFDVVDPNAATIVASFHERLPDAAAWKAALAKAGITPTAEAPMPTSTEIRFDVAAPVAEITAKLEAAELFAARVDPVTRHHVTTWAALAKSPATGFTVDAATIPDATIDLIGLYTDRAVPADAYALVVGERPADYWYILPITIGLAVIGLVFAWALVRAVRRDLLPPRA